MTETYQEQLKQSALERRSRFWPEIKPVKMEVIPAPSAIMEHPNVARAVKSDILCLPVPVRVAIPVILLPPVVVVMNRLMLRDILEAVSRVCMVSVKDICSKRRWRSWVAARHLFFFIAKFYNKSSYPKIGKACNCDHSTVMHAVRKINQDIFTYGERIIAIKKQLGIAV